MDPFAVGSLGEWSWSSDHRVLVYSNIRQKSWIYLYSSLAFPWSKSAFFFLWKLAKCPSFLQYKQRLFLNLWSCSSCVSLPLFIWTASTSIGTTSGVDRIVGVVEGMDFVDAVGFWFELFSFDSSFHSKSHWCRFSQPIRASGQSIMLTRLSLIAGFNPFMKQLIFVCMVISQQNE